MDIESSTLVISLRDFGKLNEIRYIHLIFMRSITVSVEIYIRYLYIMIDT